MPMVNGWIHGLEVVRLARKKRLRHAQVALRRAWMRRSGLRGRRRVLGRHGRGARARACRVALSQLGVDVNWVGGRGSTGLGLGERRLEEGRASHCVDHVRA